MSEDEQPWRPPTSWRALLDNERSLLELLLSQEFPGVNDLRAQLPDLRAQQGCGCGCGTISLSANRTKYKPASVTKQPVQSEASVQDENDMWRGGLILFARDGFLSCLEIYCSGEPEMALPTPERIRLSLT